MLIEIASAGMAHAVLKCLGGKKLLDSIRSAVYRLLKFDLVVSERNRLREQHAQLKSQLDELYVPPGHFFSPLPSIEEVRKEETRIFGNVSKQIPGLDLNEKEQLSLLQELARFYEEVPFEPHEKPGLRY